MFAALRAIRAFRLRHLDILETREDIDLALEIGFHQERGAPLTMKQLQLMGLASAPTLQRRLRRLREAGAIVVRRSEGDRRAMELTLSSKLLRAYGRYADFISKIDLTSPALPQHGE